MAKSIDDTVLCYSTPACSLFCLCSIFSLCRLLLFQAQKLAYCVRITTSERLGDDVGFAVCSGVRQGSCLPPASFNVFMNMFFVKLKLLDVGCHIGFMHLCFILYTLNPSVCVLPKND